MQNSQTDVVIIGAGAAGLMCAAAAGKRGRSVMVIDHATRIAEKIRISGGGRCNFTNIHTAPDKFLSRNPHFCKSALQRYSQHDFLALVQKHGIAYHEKTLGQLFCDHSARDIIDMLLQVCADAGVTIRYPVAVTSVERVDDGFVVTTGEGQIAAQAVVVATGGLSIPKIGATGFGYDLARQFNIPVVPTRAGLVPLTFDPELLEYTRDLSGLSVDPIHVHSQSGMMFKEAMLFTHRGLSGPAILQISSYWQDGQPITVDLLPDMDMLHWLKTKRLEQPRQHIHTILADVLPKRLAQRIADGLNEDRRMADLSDKILQQVYDAVKRWSVIPAGSEGYRTAEVTLGGIDTDALSSKTFECRHVPGLYFIGEVVDVTGHLGGYNFQWAWSSGWCAGQFV